MTYNYTNTTPMMTTTMSTTGTLMTGTLTPYSTLGTYGNYGGANSIFDYALKSQDTNQTMTSQAMTNNYNNAYQGNVLSATATGQTTEVQKLAKDMCNLIQNNQLDQFLEKWEEFKLAVAQNPIYSQAIDTSDGKAVSAMAESVFQELTGYSIQDVLQSTSDNAFINGMKSGSSLGAWGSGTSRDDALAYLSGTEVRASSQSAEVIGGATGGSLTAAGGTMAVVGAIDGIATVFGKEAPIKSKNLGKISLIAAFAGLAVGSLSAGIKMIQDKETN